MIQTLLEWSLLAFGLLLLVGVVVGIGMGWV